MTCPLCGQEHDTTVCPPPMNTPRPSMNEPEKKYFGMTGWKCPNCGAGCSPYTSVCPVCRPYTFGEPVITYTIGSAGNRIG